MSEGKQIANGMAVAPWDVSAQQGRGFPFKSGNTAQPPEACQATETPYLAPLLATPAEAPAGPDGRAELLHRALTNPWRFLAPRRTAAHTAQGGAWGGVERSCHAFGSAAPARSAAAAGGGDISAPGRVRVDRRSTASAASQRSLFTVDGLPEPLAPDPSILILKPSESNGRGDGSGSGQRGPRPLQHAATALGTVAIVSGAAEPGGPAQPARQSHSNHVVHPLAQERIGHRLAIATGSSGPSMPYGVSYSPGTAVDGRYRPELGLADGGPRPQAPRPHPYPQHLFAQHPHPHPHPDSGPPQQQHPAPAMQPVTAGSSAASGATGLLGTMHHLLQLPGGADAFARSRRQAVVDPPPAGGGDDAVVATQSAEALLPLQEGRNGGVGAATVAAPARAVGGTAAAAPQPPPASAALPVPGPMHPDDVRNPMSFYYDPSLDPEPQPRQQQLPAYGVEPHRCRTAAPYGQGDVGSGGQASAPPDASVVARVGNGESSERAWPSAGCSGAARCGLGSASAGGGGEGGDGAEVVASDGNFVVLEMKGPRGTPSTHAAAAAAFASGAAASPAAPDAVAAAAGMSLTLRGRVASYLSKWRGVGDTLMPADTPVDIFWSWLGASLSIVVVALLNQYLTPHVNLPFLIASFGASAVLLFGVPASKLAQPRNFLGGQLVSSIVGVLVRLAFTHAPHLVWLSASLGMSLSLAAMQLTRTTHPPGGASALIASSAPYIGPWYGFKFVLTVFFGCMAMLAVALGINNLSSRRRYPTYWMGS